MKIFTATQVRDLDLKTTIREPISAQDLMERAAHTIVKWIDKQYNLYHGFFNVLCGPGNNGGDGFAVARLLHDKGYRVRVYHPEIAGIKSKEALTNYRNLQSIHAIELIIIDKHIKRLDGIIIDAIFGTGLSRHVNGFWQPVIDLIAASPYPVISIDMPSGLPSEGVGQGSIVKATHTLALQHPRLSFFLPEHQDYVGCIHLIDIGLHLPSAEDMETNYHLLTRDRVVPLLRHRRAFDHKGIFGHALLICGGHGKAGAAILAAKGCLRSGTGKLTVQVPRVNYNVLQLGVPEAMVALDDHDYHFTGLAADQIFDAVGVGCGIGTGAHTADGLLALFTQCQGPFVLDADALNILAARPGWTRKIPRGTVITPHVGEYQRLFGPDTDGYQRLIRQAQLSADLGITIVCKGAHTCITTPAGQTFFNTTGNPGMATAGSGDVLTGIITGFLAQGYPPEQAALLGVYLHGLAGDLAAKLMGQEALLAGDLTKHLGAAFLSLSPSPPCSNTWSY